MKTCDESLAPWGGVLRFLGIGGWRECLLFSMGVFMIVHLGPRIMMPIMVAGGDDAAAGDVFLANLTPISDAVAYTLLVVLGGVSLVNLIRTGLRRQGPTRFSAGEIGLCVLYAGFVAAFPFMYYGIHL